MAGAVVGALGRKALLVTAVLADLEIAGGVGRIAGGGLVEVFEGGGVVVVRGGRGTGLERAVM